MVKKTAKKFRFFFRILSGTGLFFCISGCGLLKNELPSTLADFRKAYPKTDRKFQFQQVLTLEDARKTALKNNPDYRSMYHAVEAAKQLYYQSMSAYLPSVDYQFGVGQAFENNGGIVNPPDGVFPQNRTFQVRNSFQASYLVFDGLAREFAVLTSQKQYRAERASDENVKRLLLRGVAYAYFDIILAREKELIARSNLDFQISSLEQAEIRYKSGHVSKASVLNFKILASMARSSMLDARYQAKTARYALLALMGYSTEELPPNLKLVPLKYRGERNVPEIEYYLDAAVLNRPDLKEHKLLLEIARYRKYSAYSQFLPVVRANAGFGAATNADKNSHWTPDDTTHDFYNNTSFQYSVTSQWNLFSGFSSYRQVKAEIQKEFYANFRLESIFLSVVNEVRSAYANYRNALEQVEIFHEMLQWVFEQRNLVQAEYWGGNETITRLNGAQSDLVEAEGKLAIALVGLEKSIAQLNAAVNLPLETENMHTFGEPDSGTPLEDILNLPDSNP